MSWINVADLGSSTRLLGFNSIGRFSLSRLQKKEDIGKQSDIEMAMTPPATSTRDKREKSGETIRWRIPRRLTGQKGAGRKKRKKLAEKRKQGAQDQRKVGVKNAKKGKEDQTGDRHHKQSKKRKEKGKKRKKKERKKRRKRKRRNIYRGRLLDCKSGEFHTGNRKKEVCIKSKFIGGAYHACDDHNCPFKRGWTRLCWQDCMK